MKWFKHFSDAYVNIKHQQLIAEFGLEIYAFYWICLELIAQQGVNFELANSKSWKSVLKFQSHLSKNKVEIYLKNFAKVGLIDEKALENGNLAVPKMKEYADEYTAKLLTKSGVNRDNVGLEVDKKKNRIDYYSAKADFRANPKISNAEETKQLLERLKK